MPRRTTADSGPPTDFEFTEDFDATEFIGQIEEREAVRRSGPGTIARRTLDALAERRRLDRELAELENYEDA
jgi:hypothetical protein